MKSLTLLLLFIALLSCASYQVIAQQSRLPVALSFNYEHPATASTEVSMTPSSTQIPSTTTEATTLSQNRNIRNQDTTPKIQAKTDEMNEDEDVDSLKTVIESSGGQEDSNNVNEVPRRSLQLNDASLNMTIEKDSRRMNDTNNMKNTTTITKESKITRIEEPELKRTPNTTISHRRNTTTIIDKRDDRVKKQTNITEEVGTDKNSTDVIFPGGRGRKNDTKETSSAPMRYSSSISWVALATIILVWLQ